MSEWPNNIARKAIAEMTAYSARGASTDALHLDANESPWSPPPSDATVRDFNRYPAQQPPALRARLAGLYGVSADQIMMGRGADEAIDVLLRTFCEAGEDSILVCPPTFSYFKIAATVQGARVIEVPMDNHVSPNWRQIKTCLREDKPKLMFICSPNNPTGHIWNSDEILNLAKVYEGTLFVVDQAYVEFSAFSDLLLQSDLPRNIVILRTLSKAYGLAGVRMGVAIADPAIIDLMLKVLPPYPVPRPVEDAVMRAVSPAAMAIISERMQVWISERERMIELLPCSEFVSKAFPSEANFILFETENPAGLLAGCARYNVKIRDFRSKIDNHFRISIGTPEENDIALLALGINPARSDNDRIGEVFRKTNETDIAVRVNLDNTKTVEIETGIGFFDHMLEQIAKHGGMGLSLTCKGDLEIDSHHSVEDTALAFGAALKQALGNKAGIGRYGFVMPMDETQARVAIDLSGRPAFTFKGEFPTETIGEFATEMCPHFFQSLSQSLGASIQIDVEGDNSHHMVEACFKGVGRALRPAFARIGGDIPSTKGLL